MLGTDGCDVLVWNAKSGSLTAGRPRKGNETKRTGPLVFFSIGRGTGALHVMGT